MCYQVNIHTTELGYCYGKMTDVSLKFYSSFHVIRDTGPCMEHTLAWVTHRGSRIPYIHAQCMPIRVPGSRVPWSRVH